MLVHVLDRVLDGEDVHGAGLVDAGDDGGERGRLARAGGTGHQDEAARQPGHPLGHRGQSELLEGRDVGGDHAEGQRHLAPLVERAATEPGPIEPGHGEVHVEVLLEDILLILGEHAAHDGVDLVAR